MSEAKTAKASIERGAALPMPIEIAIEVEMLPHWIGGEPFRFGSDEATAFDLVACIDPDKPITLGSGQRVLVPTGLRLLKLEVPQGNGYVTPDFQIRSRSGLALKHGIQAHPGTIDADYRGEIQVLLFNFGSTDLTIRRGDRIAQAVIGLAIHFSEPRVYRPRAERGEGGFGSTGK